MHKLEPLHYDYDSLEPFIDEQTMRIHHDKHHQAYVDKLNAALQEYPDLQEKKVEDLLKDINKIPEKIRAAVRNHGGGHVNHAFFWGILKKGVKAQGPVIDAINKQWGTFDKFKEELSAAAMNRFGSGWAWLVVNNGKLEIISTANQDSPLSEGKKPLLGVDVWEHAYYLKYQNRRNEYVTAFFSVIDWDKVNQIFKQK